MAPPLGFGGSAYRIRWLSNAGIISIRSFCVRKHSWHIIDSVRGASASALLYSIAESAKANQLKPYEYFVHLLKELLKYPRENVPEEELKKLMP